jgi:hypothetical protein
MKKTRAARRRLTARTLRRLYRETRSLRRQVATLEGRLAVASTPPDAAMAEVITSLRERLKHQEDRFGAANERHRAFSTYQETRLNIVQKKLTKALAEIARLKGSPSPS